MPRPLSPGSLVQVARDLGRPRFMMSRLWGRRASWQVRLRWGVPPALVLAALAGPSVGVVVEVPPLLFAAGFILLYNLAFALAFQRIPADRRSVHSHDRLHTILQVALDYAAMFYLVHFTGGPASPLIYFFLFHVIAAAMLFRPSTAYLFALLATVGMAAMAYAKYQGFIPCHAVFVGGDRPLVEFTLENLLSEPICYAFISPTGAQNWGMDKLGPDLGILPGDTAAFFVAAGIYDLLLENCDQAILVEEYELDIREAAAYQITE